MKSPLRGRRPTQHELMEFVDGTLLPQRFQEIESMAAQSRTLQHEIAMVTAVRKAVRDQAAIPTSKKFTVNVMNEILPAREASLWFRLAKNSSNLFAMVLVLSMIGIVLVSGPGGSKNEAEQITKSVELYSTVYTSLVEGISDLTKQFSQPVAKVSKSPSGRFMIMGIAAFCLFLALDELLGKKYFRARIKH